MEIINNPLLDNDGQVTGERHRQYSFEGAAGKDFLAEGNAEHLQSLVASVAVATGLPEHGVNDLHLLAWFHDKI